jgi:hypothetical protein
VTCNLCYPLCSCGAEALSADYCARVESFLRSHSPEVRALEALLQAYAVAA